MAKKKEEAHLQLSKESVMDPEDLERDAMDDEDMDGEVEVENNEADQEEAADAMDAEEDKD